MPLARSLRRRLASIVALALLFAQLAVAAHACPRGTTSAHYTSMAGMPCELMMASQVALDQDQPALCFAHCQADAAQQPDLTQPAASAPSITPSFVLAPAANAAHDAPVWLVRERARWRTAPIPHSIAHCCWRI